MDLHPIHQAIEDNDLSEVQRLITEEPTLLELRDGDNYTPLMLASCGGHEELVAWLIDQGANIEAHCNPERYTSLYLACIGRHLRVGSRLVKAGANIHATDNNGVTMLMEAVWFNRNDVVAFLLNQKVINLDAQELRHGWTSLHHAAKCNRLESIKRLIAAGADPRITNNQGRTPLDVATSEPTYVSNHECVRLLEIAMAQPDRVRLLHRARSINDAHYAINKADDDAKDEAPEVRKEKCITAAPTYLKQRMIGGGLLPVVGISAWTTRKRGGAAATEDEEDVVAGVVEHVVMEGKLVKEIFVELMEMMVMKWDDERRRT